MTTTDETHSPAETPEEIASTPPTPPTPPRPPAPPEARSALPAQTEAPKTQAPEPDANRKSPALAVLLAIIPFGLGHLYLGLYNRALLFFGAFWFSIYLEAPVIAVFFYFFAVIDAFRHAQLINSVGTEGEEPIEVGKGALNLGVFLVVVGIVLLLRNWIDINQIRYFLQDYSPVILVLAGLYLIVDAMRERSRKSLSELDSDTY